MSSFHGAYKILNEVGSGVYGIVEEVECQKTKKVFVSKKVLLRGEGFQLNNDVIWKEIHLHNQLKVLPSASPHLLYAQEIYYSPDFAFYIFEKANFDLHKYLEKQKDRQLSVNWIRNVFFQILLGLEFLHRQNWIHCDLKSENILLFGSQDQDSFLVKICDFSLVQTNQFVYHCFFGKKNERRVKDIQTLWERSPEILDEKQKTFDQSVDLWSAGCILLEMVQQKRPFQGEDEKDQWRLYQDSLSLSKSKDQKKNPTSSFNLLFPKSFEKETLLKDLAWKLLQWDPSKRISCIQALQHPFFSSIQTPLSLSLPKVFDQHMIYKNLLEFETWIWTSFFCSKISASQDYLSLQNHLSEMQLLKVVDYVLRVSYLTTQNPQCFFLFLSYLDQYLSRKKLSNTFEIYTVAVCLFQMACGWTNHQSVDESLFLNTMNLQLPSTVEDEVCLKNLQRIEEIVLECVKDEMNPFQLNVPHTGQFLCALFDIFGTPFSDSRKEIKFRGFVWMAAFRLNSEYFFRREYKPSHLAFASLFVACKHFGSAWFYDFVCPYPLSSLKTIDRQFQIVVENDKKQKSTTMRSHLTIQIKQVQTDLVYKFIFKELVTK